VTLVEATLAARLTEGLPRRLVGDKAYDSDPLDERLRELGVEMVSPHRKNRVRPATQEEGPLEAYKERWRIERLFAWLQNHRRVLVRHERKLANYLGFVQLGCALILMRRL
jgi:transposase